MSTITLTKSDFWPTLTAPINETKFVNKLQEDNWIDKYRHDNESLDEFFWRIANACASIEEDKAFWAQQYYALLKDFQFTTGGRISANVGTGKKGKTLFNCFINGPVRNATIEYTRSSEDGQEIPCKITTPDNPDNLFNIMLTVLEQAKTLATDGGYGINLSWIRPRGSVIKGIGIAHPGVCAYMDILDTVSSVIVRGNNDGYKDVLDNHLSREEVEAFQSEASKLKSPRKGAMMLCLNIDHPDIEEFIKLKRESGRITKANLSVVISDSFMRAVENDELWELKFDDIIYKRVKAGDLYNLIMESTWNYNDPGVIFVDNANRYNPIIYMGEMDCTNPCGEIGGNPLISTVCLLGSINLTRFVNSDRSFDWDKYRNYVRVAARLLDSINDLERQNAIPQYNWVIKNIRQFGMGINGLGSALHMMGIKYGNNPECLNFTEKVNQIKFYECWNASAELAKEKGVFPAYRKHAFISTKFFNEMLAPFPDLQEKIREHGVRNAKCTTNPPLGNSSVICGNVSNGIEPIFSDHYERTYIIHKWPDGLTKDNIKSVLTEIKQGKDVVWRGEYRGATYLYEPHNRGLCQIEQVTDFGVKWTKEHGYVEEPVLANTITVNDHVAVMKVCQKWIEQSVSKTANLPADFSLEETKSYYMDAWKAGLIGVTTYREGTMASVLSKIEQEPERVIKTDNVKLPEVFENGPTHIIRANGHKFYIHFSFLPEDKDKKYPVALWISYNGKKEFELCKKACVKLRNLALDKGIHIDLVNDSVEKCKNDASHNQVARMVSLNLRHNVSIGDIISTMENIDGDDMYSPLTAIRRFLSKHVKDGTKVTNFQCPNCKSEQVEYSGGCKTCKDCGWTACS